MSRTICSTVALLQDLCCGDIRQADAFNRSTDSAVVWSSRWCVLRTGHGRVALGFLVR